MAENLVGSELFLARIRIYPRKNEEEQRTRYFKLRSLPRIEPMNIMRKRRPTSMKNVPRRGNI